MKVLVAYDASETAKAAIDDLRTAGLPSADIEARVLTVGEFHAKFEGVMNLEPGIPIVRDALESAQELVRYAREAAEADAEDGKKALSVLFPNWKIETEARLGSPASTLLEVAESWEPDLIVMGSHGRSALGRFFLGSMSMRVLSEAKCSVRITKQQHMVTPVILLAFDGSEGARKAVHQLVHRSWPMGTKLHLVTVIDVSVLSSLTYLGLLNFNQDETQTQLEQMLHALECEMKKYFQTVTTASPIGTPVNELLAEAKRVQATTIFIGSHGLSNMERVLLGSVSHGIAARGEQTIEIVR